MQKTELKINFIGEKILRRKASEVRLDEINDNLRNILSEMAHLMYKSKGIGLAAQQAGIDKAIVVIDVGSGLYKLINPRIVSRSGLQIIEEGCLSIPGVSVKVKRAESVVVYALNEYGASIEIKAEGLLACALQHEIDHLNGRLIIDYLNFFGKFKVKGKIKKIEKGEK